MKTLSPLRVGRITASRAPAILGLSPYVTRDEVLREMVREVLGAPSEFVSNPAIEWGNDHEAEAVSAFEQHSGLVVMGSGEGQETVVHPSMDWFAATPDGLIGDDTILEVKCPWKAGYASIEDRPDYAAQVQMQLACTGRTWAWFVVWRPSGLSVSEVPADDAWLGRNLRAFTEFRDDLAAVLDDPALHGPFLGLAEPQRDDFDWQVAALEFLEADAVMKRAEETRGAARARLIELAGDKTDRGAGVQVIRSERKGSVDNAAALKDNLPGIDLEPYRKPATVVFTVRGMA